MFIAGPIKNDKGSKILPKTSFQRPAPIDVGSIPDGRVVGSRRQR